MSLGPDILLTSTGDLDLSIGDLQQVESLSQAVRIAILMVLGEWYLDTSAGIPYFTDVWVKNPDLDQIGAYYRSVIQSVPGVDTIDVLEVSLNNTTRTLSVTWAVTATDGTPTGIQVTSV